jgi:hypothetical protein
LFCAEGNKVLVEDEEIGVGADWVKIKVNGVELIRKDGAVIVDKDELRCYGFLIEYPMKNLMEARAKWIHPNHPKEKVNPPIEEKQAEVKKVIQKEEPKTTIATTEEKNQVIPKEEETVKQEIHQRAAIHNMFEERKSRTTIRNTENTICKPTVSKDVSIGSRTKGKTEEKRARINDARFNSQNI